MPRYLAAFILAAATCLPASAQQAGHGHHDGHQAGGASPYSGLEVRAIKALSDQQIADLRAGRGMGLALAAELNGYPGPLHVVELAERLDLTGAQRSRMKALYDAMKNETVALGERLIQREVDLDRLFATRTATRANLVEATSAISATQAELRAAHLRYHLFTVEVLTPEQVARYNEARGYVRR